MTASDLSEWIAVFLPELTPDGMGGDRESIPLGLVADTPANVRPVSGSEVFSGDQIAQRVSYAVTIRYEAMITPVYRVMWRDKFFNIESVENLRMADKWMEIRCVQHEAGEQ